MMLDVFEWIGRRALFCLDPETAHGLSIKALKSGLPVAHSPHHDLRLRTTVAGVTLDGEESVASSTATSMVIRALRLKSCRKNQAAK